MKIRKILTFQLHANHFTIIYMLGYGVGIKKSFTNGIANDTEYVLISK